jgi:dipeptidase
MIKRIRPAAWVLAVMATILLVYPSSPLSACSTVVVGKKASPTGRVILGHNEDNSGPLVMVRYVVPHGKHGPGEILTFEEGRAPIPQVEETAGFQWSETLAAGGASFSDSFVNEWGVAVVSDSCWPSKETRGELTQGGIAYALRRVVASRARTARQAVALAASLLDEFGYADSGRTYIFADKDEGWLLEVVMGKHYAAQRVPDDAVAFIPNYYTIRGLDPQDTENFFVSPGLIDYALSRGWYKPAVEGSTDDFDFRKAFAGRDLYCVERNDPKALGRDSNILRHKRALEFLTGRSWSLEENYPFSVKPAKAVGVEDIQALLRLHRSDPAGPGDAPPEPSPHVGGTICGLGTQESLVVELRDEPRLTVVWRATGRPCTSPYVPWYLGITKVPDGYGWTDPEMGLRRHFRPEADDLAYDPDRAWWNFIDAQDIIEPQYGDGDTVSELSQAIREFEDKSRAGLAAVDGKARALLAKNPEAAAKVLTEFTNARAQAARDLARDEYQRLASVRIKITDPDIRRGSTGAVLLVAILSGPGFDAAQVDPDSVALGLDFVPPRRWAEGSGLLQDFDEDGKTDMVMAFSAAGLLRLTPPGRWELWLKGKTRQGKTFVARDFLRTHD